MNYIVKKIGMSMVTGAAYMFGSWMTRHVLEKQIKNRSDRRTDNQKGTNPA